MKWSKCFLEVKMKFCGGGFHDIATVIPAGEEVIITVPTALTSVKGGWMLAGGWDSEEMHNRVPQTHIMFGVAEDSGGGYGPDFCDFAVNENLSLLGYALGGGPILIRRVWCDGANIKMALYNDAGEENTVELYISYIAFGD